MQKFEIGWKWWGWGNCLITQNQQPIYKIENALWHKHAALKQIGSTQNHEVLEIGHVKPLLFERHYEIMWNRHIYTLKPRLLSSEFVLTREQQPVMTFKATPHAIVCSKDNRLTATALPVTPLQYSAHWTIEQPTENIPLETLGVALLIQHLHWSHQGRTRH